ncbi:hypothetical protein AXG93_815s1400 [Marchantia polymorpha subsp. ruderalis]|uniref:Uncharacterized protein n=1 Tax=Marchantia polymorpha subsp. ruderalis TaxID=1480154 RepID=A0A176W098_MARPO|nr:hypothetical protein AXG93_815s1400 [Marchantia polymorpha subsp. ruderalis]
MMPRFGALHRDDTVPGSQGNNGTGPFVPSDMGGKGLEPERACFVPESRRRSEAGSVVGKNAEVSVSEFPLTYKCPSAASSIWMQTLGWAGKYTWGSRMGPTRGIVIRCQAFHIHMRKPFCRGSATGCRTASFFPAPKERKAESARRDPLGATGMETGTHQWPPWRTN